MGFRKRIEDTVDEPETGWAARWADRLKEWIAGVMAWGLDLFFMVLAKAFAPKLKPIIDTMEQTGEVPKEIQPILDELKTPQGEVAAIFGWTVGGAVIGGAVGKMVDAMFMRFSYSMLSWFHPYILNEAQQTVLWRRGDIKADELTTYLRKLGFDDAAILGLQNLSEIRLDPTTITQIWLRDKEKYEKFWKDLWDQGWTTERIAIAKELANIIPPLADMVRFADFGAFDPAIIELWRKFYDAPDWIKEPMSLLGITDEWANKYWFSHWRQPGRYELGELHRRGLIDDNIVKNAYLTQGYSSFWQDLLLELVKEPWTRVDVRRMWDMRTIDEEQLRKAYQAVGYYDKQLEGMILWTKVYVAFPDLMSRWTNGWITLEEVKAELTNLGMPADRVEELVETKIKAAEPERTADERALTKSEIVKGVKKELISWDEGVELLEDLGYDTDEADYILAVNLAVAAGSPETFAEFKELTQKWRKSTGVKAKPMPEELKQAAAEVVRLTKEVETINRSIADEKKGLVAEEVLPEETTARLKELQVTLHRTEAELARARSEYDRQLAEWRHKAG